MNDGRGESGVRPTMLFNVLQWLAAKRNVELRLLVTVGSAESLNTTSGPTQRVHGILAAQALSQAN